MPAAQRQAGDARGRYDAGRDGQAEGMGGVVDVALRATGANPGSPGLGVDANALYRRQVDDQAVVHTAKARSVVAAAPDGDGEAVVASEIDRSHHIGDVGAAGNGQRPLVDHAVVEGACVLVGWVRRLDELTAQTGLQIRDFACVDHDVSSFIVRSMENGSTNSERAGAKAPGW